MTSSRPALRRIVIASANRGKVDEFRALLPPDVLIQTAGEIGVRLPEETGETFRENALLKARAVARATGLITIADDSGLEVDALGGDPGVFSARYAASAGREPSDEENNCVVLTRLRETPGATRTARFRSVVAVVAPGGYETCVEGVVEGWLLEQPRGDGGFGYDPLFVPVGYDQTMAELSLDEKNKISHRGRAFRKATNVIEGLLSGDGEVAEYSECGTLTRGTDSAW